MSQIKFSYENLVAAFLAGTNDAYIVLDNKFNVLLFNEHYIGFHSTYTTTTIAKNENFIDSIKGTTLHFLVENIQQCIQLNENKKFNYKIPVQPEKYFDIEIHLLIDNNKKVEGVALGFFDVTQRYKTAEEIKKSEKLFKALVLNSTDAFQLTNDELKINFVSDSVKNVLGFDAEELVQSNFFNLVHPDDKMLISKWLHWIIENPVRVHSVELRIKNKSNDWIYIEIIGSNLLHIADVEAIVMNYRNIQGKKAAEKALAMAEQRMGLLLNNTKESFIVVNSRLRVVTYNKAAQEHSPYFFKEELQSGVSLLSLTNDSDMEDVINLFEKVFDGNEVVRESNFTDKNNIQHIYSHSFRPLYSEDEIVGVFITSTEITEKKLAEEQLKFSEEKYKTFIQESEDAVIIINKKDIVVEASPLIHKIFGYTSEEVIGRAFIDFIHPDYKEVVLKSIHNLKMNPYEIETLDLLLTHKSKENIWGVMKARNSFDNKLIDGIIIWIRNITKRKLIEEALQLSEQRFRYLVQTGGDMISIANDKGALIYSSPTVKNVLGNDPEQNIGKNVFEYIHPEEREKLMEYLNDLILGKKKQIRLEPFRYLNAKNEYRWLEGTVTNLLNEPAVKGIVVNTRDVTENKILNDKQNILREKLIRNNQDLQQFSFITSHNLRAPVANLLGLLNLFNKENFADSFNQVLIEKFEEATNQLNTTLNDLIEILVLKSEKEIQVETINLKKLLKQVASSLENELQESKMEITTDFSATETVEYNKVYLESIMVNMLTNSIKYRSNKRKPIVHISTKIDNEYIILAFADNGNGIDLERYGERLFAMYQRFNVEKEGKGLGLYIVKSQVAAMGGKIEVESTIDIGTIFKIYIKNNAKV